MNDDSQSLANQLGWCITTRDYLNDLISELKDGSNSYGDIVQDLKHHNYMAELLPRIQEMQNEFQKNVDDLIKHIEDKHLEYIGNQSKIIMTTLSSL